MTLKHITAALAAAALLAPTAVSADSGKSKGRSGDKPATHQKGQTKAKNTVFKGTVVSFDAAAGSVVVHVTKANSKRGRRFKGQDVTFTLATVKKLGVNDTNADGKADLNDVKAGDRVSVHARITREAEPPFAARKFKVHAPEAAPSA